MHPKEVFGTAAVLDPLSDEEKRTATVIAVEQVDLLVIERKNFEHIEKFFIEI